jgi:hypothetical protein
MREALGQFKYLSNLAKVQQAIKLRRRRAAGAATDANANANANAGESSDATEAAESAEATEADAACPVCTDAIPADKAVVLPCGHVLCYGCTAALVARAVGRWVRCPSCRRSAEQSPPPPPVLTGHVSSLLPY